MRLLSDVVPSAEALLALSTRALAGVFLEQMNAAGDTRFHPKTLRNDIERAYPGTLSADAALHAVRAVALLSSEGYLERDYKDTTNFDWLAVTEKGKRLRDRRELMSPGALLTSNKPLVFISCGQSADHEKRVGKRIAQLILDRTEAVPFFAENEHTLKGLSENILAALNKMRAFVIVMHKRGNVSSAFDPDITRGSLWIEQEVAIAAALQQSGKRISVAAYIERGIEREGLRSLLQLNEVQFSSDDEVVDHFAAMLAEGTFDVGSAAVAAPPGPIVNAIADLLSPEQARSRGLPMSSAYRVVLKIRNAGLVPATKVAVDLLGLRDVESHRYVGAIAAGGNAEPVSFMVPFTAGGGDDRATPHTIVVSYDGDGFGRGKFVLEREAGSHPPKWAFARETRPSKAS